MSHLKLLNQTKYFKEKLPSVREKGKNLVHTTIYDGAGVNAEKYKYFFGKIEKKIF